MRLPCDATLIVVEVCSAIDNPRWDQRANPGAQAAMAALLAAWRAEKLPVIHLRHDSIEPDSPHAPGKSGRASKPGAPGADPRPGERIVAMHSLSAFVDTPLEEELDALGATTLVLCGVMTANSLEATARHAGDLGYRVFVVADACWVVDKLDRARWLAGEEAPAASPAHLGDEYAEIVDCARTLKAAATANARARRGQAGH
jgi:nicotinamidase-related amidase